MLSVILPWFPIVLSSAIGARLVGRSRATWLGLSCTVYFVIVVQMTTGVVFWTDPGNVAAVLAGSAAIFGIAEWSARFGVNETGERTKRRRSEAHGGDATCRSFTRAMEEFDQWLAVNSHSPDAWSAFDEFLRNLLYYECGAKHCRPFRILSEGDLMVPLAEMEPADGEASPRSVAARRGITGHVSTTGRSYYAGDESQGEMVASLADRSRRDGPVGGTEWCFAIRQGVRTIGIVWVGELDSPAGRPPTSSESKQWGNRAPAKTGLHQSGDRDPLSLEELRAWERLISQFWITLAEVCRSRAALAIDPVSELMTRNAFLDEATRISAASYQVGEPLAVCAITVEGLRTLMDQGRWDLANDVVREVGKFLRHTVRPDDLLGRFDDSRFMVTLWRVDSELASLIATKLAERLSSLISGEHLLSTGQGSSADQLELTVRCGVAGSGNGGRDVGELVKSALQACHEARTRCVDVATDLDTRAVDLECSIEN